MDGSEIARRKALAAATPDWKFYVKGTLGNSLEIRRQGGLQVRVVRQAGRIVGPWIWEAGAGLVGLGSAVSALEAAPVVLYAAIMPLPDQVRISVGTTASGGGESFLVADKNDLAN